MMGHSGNALGVLFDESRAHHLRYCDRLEVFNCHRKRGERKDEMGLGEEPTTDARISDTGETMLGTVTSFED